MNTENLDNNAYIDLNNNNEDMMVEFEEPYELKLSDNLEENLDTIINDTEEEDNNKKQLAIIAVGIAMFIICCIGILQAITTNKTVEFSTNGIKNLTDWNKFKENCNASKKDSIVVKIMSKDELESKNKLIFDGKYYTYGKSKEKYKYLIDEKGTIQDLGADIRFIVLSNKKYKFEQLYQGMSEMDKENYEYVDVDSLNESVKNITDTLDEIDKDMSSPNEKTLLESDENKNVKENDKTQQSNNEKIVYKLIFYY